MEADEFDAMQEIANQLTRIADFFQIISDSWQEEESEGNPGPIGTTDDADDWRALEPVMSDE